MIISILFAEACNMFTLDLNSMNKWIKMMMSDVPMASTVKPLFQPDDRNLQHFK